MVVRSIQLLLQELKSIITSLQEFHSEVSSLLCATTSKVFLNVRTFFEKGSRLVDSESENW